MHGTRATKSVKDIIDGQLEKSQFIPEYVITRKIKFVVAAKCQNPNEVVVTTRIKKTRIEDSS